MLPVAINAQCPTGNVTLLTQAEVDDFIADYPNCTQLANRLIIGPSTDITNLNGLMNLTQLDVDLYIADNPQLSDLSGLSNLTNIEQGLILLNNPLITDLTAFSSLNFIGGAIHIQGNDNLVSFDFSTVTTSNINFFNVRDNPELITGLLPTGVTTITNYIQYLDNPQLVSISEMESLTSITNSLNISNYQGAVFPAFSNLESIGTGLVLDRNPNITSFPAFNALDSIGGVIRVSYNDNLSDFDISGLVTTDIEYMLVRDNPQLTSALLPTDVTAMSSYLQYFNNPMLQSISEMESLMSIDAYLTIDDYQGVVFPAFSNLESIGTGLSISSNPNITAFPAFTNLTSIGGVINVSYNANLMDFDISGLATNDIVNMLVRDNPQLTSALLPTDVTAMSSYLQYSNNPLLNSISEMESLESIGGYLSINDYQGAVFPAFSNLESIGTGLYISSSPNITAFPAFTNLTSMGGVINVSYNDNLAGFDISGVATNNIVNMLVRDNPQLVSALLPTDVSTISSYLQYFNNPLLNSISEMESLESIGGYLSINDYQGAVFPAFSSLESIATGLYIFTNPTITAFPSFDNLSSLGGTISIQENAQLESFDIATVTTNNIETILVQYNPVLTSALLPTDITSINTHLQYFQNPLLEELSEMPFLTTVRFLSIHNTLACELPNFPAMQHITQNFVIAENANITFIPSLAPNTVIDSVVSIQDNPNLSYCAIEAVCTFISNAGTTNISGNIGDCFDVAATSAACLNNDPFPQDLDGDGVTSCDGDCDDENDTVYPGAEELCDGLDNDCDGEIDEGEVCIACGAVVNDSISYSCTQDGAYEFSFSLENSTAYTVSSFFISSVSGFNFSQQHWTQNTELNLPIAAEGGMAGPFSIAITPDIPITSSTTLCLNISYFSGDYQCCNFEYCVTLEPLPSACNLLDLIATDLESTEACCYEVEVVNNYCEPYFTGIQTELLTSGISFQNYEGGNNWEALANVEKTVIDWIPENGYITKGSTLGMGFCLEGINSLNQSPQYIAFHWLKEDALTGETVVVCTDTLEFFCEACALVDQEVTCDSAGNYVLNLDITNNATPAQTATTVLFEVYNSGVSFSPSFVDVVLAPGAQFSTDLSILSTSSLNPGDVILYKILLIDETGWCCHIDSLEFTLPECSGFNDPEEESVDLILGQTIELFPNPSNGTFYIDLSAFQNQAVELQLYNNWGQIVHSEAILVTGSSPIEIAISGIVPGHYFVRLEVRGLQLPVQSLIILGSKKKLRFR